MLDYQGKKFHDYLIKNRIGVTEAAKTLETSRQNIYQLFKSANLSRETVNNILSKFNTTEEEVFGLKSIHSQSNGLSIGELQQRDGETKFIDLKNGKYLMEVSKVPVRAQAGYIEHYFDEQYIEEHFEKEYFTVSQVAHGKYMAFVTEGDSMDDGTKRSIPEGSTVLGRDIQKHHWRNRLHLHRFKVYVVVHKEGIFIKEITEHDVENGAITCHSYNEDKVRYADFKLSLDDCLQILNVLKVTQEL